MPPGKELNIVLPEILKDPYMAVFENVFNNDSNILYKYFNDRNFLVILTQISRLQLRY